MKRDMDLVRKILLEIEKHATTQEPIKLDVENYSSEQISYHVKILAGAGLVEAYDLSSVGDFCWEPTGLTWQGHEFLDVARNETVWSKTKEIVAEKSGSVPFGVLQNIMVEIIKSLF